MPNFHAAAETPDYLEAPDNEDSGLYCECGCEVWDDGRYPDLCHDCNMVAVEDDFWDQRISDYEDRLMFPEDYEYDHGNEDY